MCNRLNCGIPFCKKCFMLDWKVSIKLIDVQKTIDKWNGNSNTQIVTCIMRKPMKYCIISYVWDSGFWIIDEVQDNTNKIVNKTIHSCHKDSFLAMLQICKQLKLFYVWIDAICVEQNIGDTKSKQLSEMGDYYSHADKCLVFSNGLNIYGPPTLKGGGIGNWYTRAWTVQEGSLTRRKKIFLYSVPRNTPGLTKCIILSDNDLYNIVIDRGFHHIGQLSSSIIISISQTVPNTSDMCVVLVPEDIHYEFINTWSKTVATIGKRMPDGHPYYRASHDIVLSNKDVMNRTIQLNKDDIVCTIREAMSRNCRYIQDKIYSVMTILRIQSNVTYDVDLGALVKLAAEKIRPYHLAQLACVDWYAEDDCDCDCVLPRTHISNSIDMPMYNCVENIQYSRSHGLSIDTWSRHVSLERVDNPQWDPVKRQLMGFARYGVPFMVSVSSNFKVKARGVVNVSKLYRNSKLTLLFMGKSHMRDFAMKNQYMSQNVDHLINGIVVLVICMDKKDILHKIGMLYLPVLPEAPLWTKNKYQLCG